MKRVVSLHNYRDLEKYGLTSLTGEACTYGHRQLFDLSEAGARLVRTYLGLPAEARFALNWNSRVGSEPAVASVLLAHAVVRDLMVFILLHVGDFDRVLQSANGTYGFDLDDPLAATYLTYVEAWPSATTRLHYNQRKASQAPSVEGRNVHQATGRVS